MIESLDLTEDTIISKHLCNVQRIGSSSKTQEGEERNLRKEGKESEERQETTCARGGSREDNFRVCSTYKDEEEICRLGTGIVVPI